MTSTPATPEKPEAIRAGFRVSRTSWQAWGRVCGRIGSNRTARILDRMAEDIYAHGDDEDIADFEAGLAESELRQARRHIGRPPSPRPPAGAGGNPDAYGYMQVLECAMARARERYPQASPELRAAYANSVAYAVTGLSGGYGGPSAREYAANQASRDYLAVTGRRMSFAEAAEEFARPDGLIFGPLTDAHHWHWRNLPCSGDDPADAAALDKPGS